MQSMSGEFRHESFGKMMVTTTEKLFPADTRAVWISWDKDIRYLPAEFLEVVNFAAHVSELQIVSKVDIFWRATLSHRKQSSSNAWVGG